jgi:Zn-dependent peptidase ImmA (M78 family)/transcriptional regulator with XRE-family HTH domain
MARLEDIEATEIGERLRVARSEARVNQEDAAKAISLSRPTLIAIEKGARKVKLEELDQLSQLYKVPLNRLLARDAVQLDLQGRFRRVDISDKDAAEVVGQLNKLASASVELERLLGLKFAQAYLPEQPIGPGSIERQAEEAALALRHRLGLGLAPIPDIVSLLENELGIRVFVRGLPSKTAGVFAFDPAVGACILLNAKHPWERRAMTAAHECGHFLTNRSAVDMVELDESLSSPEERFANAFAYAFLLPPSGLRRRFQEIVEADNKFTSRHLILLANTFHVSIEAICRQLEKLELLPDGSFDSLKRRGLNKDSVRGVLGDLAPTDDRTPKNPHLAHLVASAYSRGLVSEGQLSQMLGMDRVDVRELIDVFGDNEEDELSFDVV